MIIPWFTWCLVIKVKHISWHAALGSSKWTVIINHTVHLKQHWALECNMTDIWLKKKPSNYYKYSTLQENPDLEVKALLAADTFCKISLHIIYFIHQQQHFLTCTFTIWSSYSYKSVMWITLTVYSACKLYKGYHYLHCRNYSNSEERNNSIVFYNFLLIIIIIFNHFSSSGFHRIGPIHTRGRPWYEWAPNVLSPPPSPS